MVRQTDRSASRAKERSGRGRRGGTRGEKGSTTALCGWNLPVLSDDNNIITWSTREQNGENIRKSTHETYEEEQFRHFSGLCQAIEDRVLFEQQSLHQKYLGHCQYDLQPASSARDPPLPLQKDSQDNPAHAQEEEQDGEELAEEDGVDEEEEEEEDEEEEEEGVGGRRSRGGRRLSAVCQRDFLEDVDEISENVAAGRRKAGEGEGFHQSRPGGEVTHDQEEEDSGWDEGYGSKVSSNDQEQEGSEEGTVEHTPATLPRRPAFVDVGQITLHKVQPLLITGSVRPVTQPDTVSSKLFFSRRDKAGSEASSGGRRRSQCVQYTGKPPVRTAPSSRKVITPASLARYNHLADLAKMAVNRQSRQDKLGNSTTPCNDVGKTPRQTESCEEASGEGSGEVPVDLPATPLQNADGEISARSRTLVLHKITIQDSGKELFSQHVNTPRRAASCASRTFQILTQPFDRVHRKRAQSERIKQERRSALPIEGGRSGLSSIMSRMNVPPFSRSGMSLTSLSEDSEIPRSCASAATVSLDSSLLQSCVSDKRSKPAVLDKAVSSSLDSDRSPSKSRGKNTSDKTSVKKTNMTSEIESRDSQNRTAASSVAETSGTCDVCEESGNRRTRLDRDQVSVQASPSTPQCSARTGAGGGDCSDRLSTLSTFPMVDLLPVLETNLRLHRSAQRLLGKARTMDVSSTLNTIKLRRQQQQQQKQQQQQQQLQQQQQQPQKQRCLKFLQEVVDSYENGEQQQQQQQDQQLPLLQLQQEKEKQQQQQQQQSCKWLQRNEDRENDEGTEQKRSITEGQENRGHPAFRTTGCPSPVQQRVKRLADRRLDGHSEMTLVSMAEASVRSSHNCGLNTEQTNNASAVGLPRVKSASRFPPLHLQSAHAQQDVTCAAESQQTTPHVTSPKAKSAPSCCLTSSLVSSHEILVAGEEATIQN